MNSGQLPRVCATGLESTRNPRRSANGVTIHCQPGATRAARTDALWAMQRAGLTQRLDPHSLVGVVHAHMQDFTTHQLGEELG